MLTTIHFHGRLGKTYGREWKLEVESVKEALLVIFRAKPDMAKSIFESDKKGVVYRVLDAAGNAVNCMEKLFTLKTDEVHIWPIVQGSKRAGLIQTIIGVVLIIVAVVLAAPSGGSSLGMAKAGVMAIMAGKAGFAAGFLFMMGVSLTIGGIAQMLTPVPKIDTSTAADDRSYIFSGSDLSTRQGVAIPIGYGTLHISGIVVSAGIYADKAGSTPFYGNDTDGDGIIDDFDGNGIADDQEYWNGQYQP